MSTFPFPSAMKKIDSLFCGCANEENTWGVVLKELERCERSEYKTDDIVAHICNWADLTEHGSAVRGVWLTEGGKEVLAFLRQHGIDWQEKGEFLDDENCMHGSPQ